MENIMAYINLLLLTILIIIWVFILVSIYKVERIRIHSLQIIKSVAHQINEIKKDFKKMKSSSNKY